MDGYFHSTLGSDPAHHDRPHHVGPQPRQTIEPKWNAEAKDRLERLICEMVCDGQLNITTAQEALARDWFAAYHRRYEEKGCQGDRPREGS
jgi:hypothetical protein